MVARIVLEHDVPVDPRDLRAETDLSDTRLQSALGRLAESGVVEMLRTGEARAAGRPPDVAEAAEEVGESQERHHAFERSRVEMMRGYAEVLDCRRRYLLDSFGEGLTEPCAYCDNCYAGRIVSVAETKERFARNSRVRHRSLDEGSGVRYEGDKIVVLFDEGGYKTLDLPLVIDEGLLDAAS
jgi:ATP-dependent DNA helicase RecQ